MKKGLIVFVFGSMLAVQAFANVSEDQPLLVKYSGNGSVAPNYQWAKSCDVYTDRVVITSTAGGGQVVAKTSVPVRLSNSIEQTIVEASKGAVSHSQLICGGGVTFYMGYYFDSDNNRIEVELGGEGATNPKNDSPVAVQLVNLLDQLCQ